MFWYDSYQDDWLKTSASSLQLWEKAPFEPYASPKHVRLKKEKLGRVSFHFFLESSKIIACSLFFCFFVQMSYYVVCPDIDPLTIAAADFFQQLGAGESFF